MDIFQQHLEALIFCASSPISKEELHKAAAELFDYELQVDHLEASLEKIKAKYQAEEFSFELVFLGGGFQFMTKPAYERTVGIYLKQKSKKTLSASALETLSIIAYQQPVTKSEVEKIRGVGCDYAIQKLLEKGLLDIKGKAELPGRPVLYGTSKKFLEYLGINSLTDLPKLKEIAPEVNQIGHEEVQEEDNTNPTWDKSVH